MGGGQAVGLPADPGGSPVRGDRRGDPAAVGSARAAGAQPVAAAAGVVGAPPAVACRGGRFDGGQRAVRRRPPIQQPGPGRGPVRGAAAVRVGTGGGMGPASSAGAGSAGLARDHRRAGRFHLRGPAEQGRRSGAGPAVGTGGWLCGRGGGAANRHREEGRPDPQGGAARNRFRCAVRAAGVADSTRGACCRIVACCSC